MKRLRNTLENRKTGANIDFALWGLTCFEETFVQGSTFVVRMNSCAKKNPQRKAAKRYFIKPHHYKICHTTKK